MSTETEPGASSPEALDQAVTALLTAATEAAGLAPTSGWMAPAARYAALKTLGTARTIADAAHLALVDTFDVDQARPLGATSTMDLLVRAGASVRQARRDVDLAAAVGRRRVPGASTQLSLPALGAAHAAGQVSTDVLQLALSMLGKLPAATRRQVNAELDTALASDLSGVTHSEAQGILHDLLELLDPDHDDRGYDPDDTEKRRLNITVHDDGWVSISGQLDPVQGAQLKIAIDHYAAPAPTVDAPLADADANAATGQTTTIADTRTATQRRADALALVSRQGLSNTETRGGEVPRIVVTATLEQAQEALDAFGVADDGSDGLELRAARLRRRRRLRHHLLTGTDATAGEPAGPPVGSASIEQTTSISPAVLASLIQHAELQLVLLDVDGAAARVLALGRSVRCFTPAQRRAMLARDGGCIVPGCAAPPAWLQAHHVHEWADGGPTDLVNGVLVCGQHHLLITLGHWQVRIVNGVPQVRPPADIDPGRPWLLNPRRTHRERTRRRAEQLLLGHPPDEDVDGPAPPLAASA